MDEVTTVTESVEFLGESADVLLQQIATNSAQSVELLTRLYIVSLFVIGVVAAVGVCVLLHKFLRLFY